MQTVDLENGFLGRPRWIFPQMLLLLLVCAASTAHAKNVILFVGDGMGISTVTAARIYAGQLQGLPGEEYDLAFDRFDHLALIKTYNTDSQVPDSAGTISAIMMGEKTRRGVLNIGHAGGRGDCAAALKETRVSLAEIAETRGLATGIVSTARITHATPAGAYAQSASRDWEDSATLPAAAKQAGCEDIAEQLVYMPEGDGLDVILGGGRRHFLPDSEADPEYPDKTGDRDDGENLIARWLAGDQQRRYVWNLAEFEKLTPGAGQILGLFEPSHMQYEADRPDDTGGEPSLADMTRLAIKQLAENEAGYFLMVEGGRIDHAHHFGNASRALQDTVALSDAVQVAVDLVDLQETLIIVTADHSHTMTISGYPRRGNPILGKVEFLPGQVLPDATGKPYTTLSYANGPGFKENRPNLTKIDTEALNYQQIASVPMASETHAGEDVAAFAVGVNAHQVRGVMEQNELYGVMLEALFPADGD